MLEFDKGKVLRVLVSAGLASPEETETAFEEWIAGILLDNYSDGFMDGMDQVLSYYEEERRGRRNREF